MSEKELFDEPINMTIEKVKPVEQVSNEVAPVKEKKQRKPRKPLTAEQIEKRRETLRLNREKGLEKKRKEKEEKTIAENMENEKLKDTVKRQRAEAKIEQAKSQPVVETPREQPKQNNDEVNELKKQLAELTKLTMDLKNQHQTRLNKQFDMAPKEVKQPEPKIERKEVKKVEPPLRKAQYQRIINTSRRNNKIELVPF